MWKRVSLFVLVAGFVALQSSPARAWTISEHIRITARGLGALSKEDRAALETAWVTGQQAGERHCFPDDPTGFAAPNECAPYAAMAALAGDHSCSPADLDAQTRAPAPSRLAHLLRVARSFDAALAGSRNDDQRLDARRQLDVVLRLVDDEYKTRASNKGAHFARTRTAVETSLEEYLAEAFAANVDVNGGALFAQYHVAALRDALDGNDQRALLREAFAQHFLQDAFASGHVIGVVGGASDQIGTHDYYCEAGIEARSWDGTVHYLAHGDAFMSSDDLDHTGRASAASFAQLASVLRSRGHSPYATMIGSMKVVEPSDVCTTESMPPGLASYAHLPLLDELFAKWIVPAPGKPLPPRFPSQLLGFLGVSNQTSLSFGRLLGERTGSYEMETLFGFTAGAALEGISSRRMEGPMYLDLYVTGAQIRDHIAVWENWGLHIHAPFAYVPGDGIPGLLLAAFTDCPLGGRLAYEIAKGTAYHGFERVHYTKAFTLQIVLGRDVTISDYKQHGGVRISEFDLRLPLFAMSQLPEDESSRARTAFGWQAQYGIDYAKRSTAYSDGRPAIDDKFFGIYFAILTQPRIYIP